MAEGTDRYRQTGIVETRTVLFADVVDSTRLYDEHGDEAARRMLVQCLNLMADVVEASGGRVEDRIGDELLCTFADPDAAAHGAGEVHRHVIGGHDAGKLDVPMRVRIGFEHGPITRTAQGLYGQTIHTAARIAALAKAGQILTTKTTLELLGPIRRRLERFFDTIVLKGIAAEQDIHELIWDTSATVMTINRPRRKKEEGTAAVELVWAGETVRVDSTCPRITLGRDSACTIRLRGSLVSRLHARVTWNRGKVEVEDVSTNGTSVEPDGGTARILHHDRAKLSGRGRLRCGALGDENDAAIMAYRCVEGGAEDEA